MFTSSCLKCAPQSPSFSQAFHSDAFIQPSYFVPTRTRGMLFMSSEICRPMRKKSFPTSRVTTASFCAKKTSQSLFGSSGHGWVAGALKLSMAM